MSLLSRVRGGVRGTRRAWKHSRPIRERWRFTRLSAPRRDVVQDYRLRAPWDGVVVIRHASVDDWVLHEVFGMHAYALPDPVREQLGRQPRVLDLGGNIGLFTLFVSQTLPDCRGAVFEPDPDSAAVLERCLDANRLADRWEVVRACAGNHDGTVAFLSGQAAMSRVLDEGETESTVRVPIHDVLGRIRESDLVKMDIEGSEWEIVLDERFAAEAPPALVVEYHPEGCPSDDPREAMLERLQALGYATHEVGYGDESVPDGQGVFWAWRG